MHFCQVLIIVISLGIDTLFLTLDYNRMSMLLAGNSIMLFLYWSMLIYDVIACILAYRAYSCFSKIFYESRPAGYSIMNA